MRFCKQILIIFFLLVIEISQADSKVAVKQPALISDANVVVGNGALTNEQMQWQLQAQELQLEQQILQIRQHLFELQKTASTQKNSSPRTDLRWTNASNGNIPPNPVVAAKAGNQAIYICHASYLQGIHPGQMVSNGCLISYAGRAFVQNDYQVLTGKHTVLWKPGNILNRWEPPVVRPFTLAKSNLPDMPIDEFAQKNLPIQGGYEQDKILYICRAMYGNQIYLGKVVNNNCNVGVDNAEVQISTYEILFD